MRISTLIPCPILITIIKTAQLIYNYDQYFNFSKRTKLKTPLKAEDTKTPEKTKPFSKEAIKNTVFKTHLILARTDKPSSGLS